MQITKKVANSIDKYFCQQCIDLDSNLTIIYKVKKNHTEGQGQFKYTCTKYICMTNSNYPCYAIGIFQRFAVRRVLDVSDQMIAASATDV